MQLLTLVALIATFYSFVVDAQTSCTLGNSTTGTDDAPRFLAAIRSCGAVTIPSTTTLNIGTRLNMTGLADRTLNLQGRIRFTPNIPYWTGNAFTFPFQSQLTFWIFGGRNLVIQGGGVLDGAGEVWYDAFATNSTLGRPIILTVFQAQNVLIQNIRMVNSPEWFTLVNEAKNVTYTNITINATPSPAGNDPHNTDGIDIYRSDNVVFKNSVINNGDDCVSLKPNATNVLVSNLNCNGSHGISVGSLGQFPGMFDIVENFTATNVIMSNAQNGARIKAWAGANVGSGVVRNVTFSGFVVRNVDNPVVIDQCYMTSATACTQFPSNTFLHDVFFRNISGSGSRSTVASLLCSPDGRCDDIHVDDLRLTPPSGNAQQSVYRCQNVVLQGNASSLFGQCTVTGRQ